MKLSSILKFGHEHFLRYGHKSMRCVDATCGNGNDTLFLAQNFNRAKIYAFDIQENAINNSKIKCENHPNIEFICDSHANFNTYLTGTFDLFIYNLGFLPNSDLQVTTNFDSTIDSISQALDLLKIGGAIILTLYRGALNLDEALKVEEFTQNLSSYQYIVAKYEHLNTNDSPYVIIIEKKR